MYVYVYIYMYVYMYLYLYLYVYVYVYIYICMYVYIYVYTLLAHTHIYIMNTLRGLTSQQKTGMSATNMKILLTLFEYMFLDIPSASNRIGKMGYKRFSLLENMKYNNLTSVRHWNDG